MAQHSLAAWLTSQASGRVQQQGTTSAMTLHPQEETKVTFPTKIMGEGNSLTSYSSADPWTRPNMVKAIRR